MKTSRTISLGQILLCLILLSISSCIIKMAYESYFFVKDFSNNPHSIKEFTDSRRMIKKHKTPLSEFELASSNEVEIPEDDFYKFIIELQPFKDIKPKGRISRDEVFDCLSKINLISIGSRKYKVFFKNDIALVWILTDSPTPNSLIINLTGGYGNKMTLTNCSWVLDLKTGVFYLVRPRL
jgi:hypothetical protein